MGFIYIIINLLNRKVYIGQTTKTIPERWEEHLFNARQFTYHQNDKARLAKQGIEKSVLYKAMFRHGSHNFIIVELEPCPDEYLNDRETHFIKQYDCLAENHRGYNLLTGGGSGGKHAEQTKKKIQATKIANVDKYRSPMLAGLPAHTSYSGPQNKGGEKFMIRPEAFGSSVIFSVKKYGSVEATKKALLDHYAAALATKNALDALAIPVEAEAPAAAVSDLESEWQPGYDPEKLYEDTIRLVELLASIESYPDCDDLKSELREAIQTALRMLNDSRDMWERFIGQPALDMNFKPFDRIEEAIRPKNITAEDEQKLDEHGEKFAAELKAKRRRNKFEGYIEDPDRKNLWQTPDGFRIRGKVGGKKRDKYFENPKRSIDEKRLAAQAVWDAFNAEENEPKQE
jgi:group I intron endonuclease